MPRCTFSNASSSVSQIQGGWEAQVGHCAWSLGQRRRVRFPGRVTHTKGGNGGVEHHSLFFLDGGRQSSPTVASPLQRCQHGRKRAGVSVVPIAESPPVVSVVVHAPEAAAPASAAAVSVPTGGGVSLQDRQSRGGNHGRVVRVSSEVRHGRGGHGGCVGIAGGDLGQVREAQRLPRGPLLLWRSRQPQQQGQVSRLILAILRGSMEVENRAGVG